MVRVFSLHEIELNQAWTPPSLNRCSPQKSHQHPRPTGSKPVW